MSRCDNHWFFNDDCRECQYQRARDDADRQAARARDDEEDRFQRDLADRAQAREEEFQRQQEVEEERIRRQEEDNSRRRAIEQERLRDQRESSRQAREVQAAQTNYEIILSQWNASPTIELALNLIAAEKRRREAIGEKPSEFPLYKTSLLLGVKKRFDAVQSCSICCISMPQQRIKEIPELIDDFQKTETRLVWYQEAIVHPNVRESRIVPQLNAEITSCKARLELTLSKLETWSSEVQVGYKAHAQHVAETRRQETEMQRQKQKVMQAKKDKWKRRNLISSWVWGLSSLGTIFHLAFWFFHNVVYCGRVGGVGRFGCNTPPLEGSSDSVNAVFGVSFLLLLLGVVVGWVSTVLVSVAAKADMKAES